MNKLVPTLLGCALTVATFSSAFAAVSLETKKDKVSYSIGRQLGMQLFQVADSLNIDKVILGLQDGQAGREAKLSENEMRTVMQEFQTDMQTQQQAKKKALSVKNGQETRAFLAANKTKEGVVTLPSGVQYKIITKGDGPSPLATDTVTVHYKGTLIDGQEFDSSYKRGEPATFPLNGVIKGWTESLQKMKVGSKWQLFIPADSAYADRGAGPMIGPDAMLIFEVELLEIKSK